VNSTRTICKVCGNGGKGHSLIQKRNLVYHGKFHCLYTKCVHVLNCEKSYRNVRDSVIFEVFRLIKNTWGEDAESWYYVDLLDINTSESLADLSMNLELKSRRGSSSWQATTRPSGI